MIVDFRTSAHVHKHILINGGEVEIVNEHRYLGTMIDSKLSWNSNTDVIHSKGQQRPQCGVDKDLMMYMYVY